MVLMMNKYENESIDYRSDTNEKKTFQYLNKIFFSVHKIHIDFNIKKKRKPYIDLK